MKIKLSTQPYRGARDFYPEDMQIQNYIYDVWKTVCKKYGFEQYEFPILEPFELFAAKTGQEIINDQLFWFTDRGNRKVAIRPELTPGTVRMIAQKFNELPKPIKWFMIGNNWRYEKPQTGRGREFNQLEVNTFGIDDVTADFEIFSLIIAIMQAFGANDTQFELKFSNRRLVNALLLDTLGLDTERATQIRRLMDKFSKIQNKVFTQILQETGLTPKQTTKIIGFLQSDFNNLEQVITNRVLQANQGYLDIKQLVDLLKSAGLQKFCSFDPTIIRGFDYSDGLVYEVFDKNPNNRRSLFGGERFDKLIELFGNYNLPATGFAMGDWTLKEFLINWNLLPKFIPCADYLITTWPSDDKRYLNFSLQLAQKIRDRGKNVFMWTQVNTKLDKQLKYADKMRIPFAIIIGEREIANDELVVKSLATNTQQTVKIKDFLKQA